MKTYYTEYVNHCLRYYFRYDTPKSDKKSEIDDWNASKRACSALKSYEKDLVKEIYSNANSVVDGLYKVSRKYNIKPGELWELMHKVEKSVAVERGIA